MSEGRLLRNSMARRLESFPGIAADIDAAGAVLFANARLREIARGAPATFEELLDDNSTAKWQRALRDDVAAAALELHVITATGAMPFTFHLTPGEDGVRTLLELPRDAEVERMQDATQAINSELVSTQREVMRQKAELQRTLEELQQAFAREERLTHELQSHNEEMEVQNEELQSLTDELREQQDAAHDLNEKLVAQAAELQRALQSRDRFYSAMSHELRTPLTAVMGYLHLLLDGIAGSLSEQQSNFIERAHTAAIHLKSLIDDVLDLAKLESGAMDLELEQTSVRDLANEVVQTVMPLAREHGSPVLLEVDEAADFLTTDARALRQILLNLLSNAAKFGASRPVRLRCTRADHDIIFEVIDRGIGIAPEDADRIFEEFVQLQAGERQGTGLGLPISRRLAQRLGGRLELESEPGAGSTFRLTLPLGGPASS